MDIGKMVPSIEMYIYTLCESDYLNEWGGSGTLLVGGWIGDWRCALSHR